VTGDRPKGDEQAYRERGYDGSAANAPQALVVQQMPKRRHEPLFTDLLAFEREFPEKAPWHSERVRFTWIVPSNTTSIVRGCLLLLAGGFAAQHSRVPASSNFCAAIMVAAVLLLVIPRIRWVAFFLLGFAAFLQSGIGVIEARLDPRFAGDSILTQVRIVDFPNTTGVTLVMLVEPQGDKRMPGRSRVTWLDPPQTPKIGDVWQLELRLRRPRGSSNPGGFSSENWMFRERLHASGYVVAGKRNVLIAENSLSAISAYRRNFVARAVAESAAAAPVLAAVGVGTRHLLSREQWDNYAKTGTSHLMAISGLHIGLAAAAAFAGLVIAFGVARVRGNHLDYAVIGSVAAAGVYAVVAGFAVPSQRATLMLVLAAVAVLGRRRAIAHRILAMVAVVVFVTDPISLMAPGFALSFGAVASLLWFGQQYSRPTPGRLLRQLASMQVLLLLGLMPLTVMLFQRVAFAAPFSNFFAVPVFSLITVPFTLTSMLVDPIWPAASAALLRIAAISVVGIDAAIEFIASLEFADTPIAGVGNFPSQFWLTILLPALWLILPRGWPGRWLALIGVVAILTHKPSAPPEGCFDTHVLDVGQGLSVVVESSQHTLVFDTGASYRGGGSAAESQLIPFLRYRRIERLDWLVVSHADDDHAGGVKALLAKFAVDQILTGEPLRLDGQGTSDCVAGRSWQVDGVDFEILHPALLSDHDGNDASCVLLLSAGDHRLLLTGDIESAGERDFLSQWPYDAVSVVLIPHHGSLTSSSPSFVNRLRPNIAIASTGYNNRWGFPKDRVRQRWEGVGARVLDTGMSGAVSLRMCKDGGIQSIRLERQQRRRFWHDPKQL